MVRSENNKMQSTKFASNDDDNESDDEDMWLNISRLPNGSRSNGTGKSSAINGTNDTNDNVELVSSMNDSTSLLLYKQLYEMEQSMRCNICHDIYHAPVSIIPCYHTYCSKCIRQHLRTELKNVMKRNIGASCPECRVIVNTKGQSEFEKCLIVNRSLEITTQHYRTIRKSLYLTLKQNHLNHNNISNNSNDNNNESDNDDDPQQKKRSRPKNMKNNHTRPSSSDAVLAVAPSSSTSSSTSHILTKRRIEMYSMMKKNKLQELCLRDGLPTHGNEQELIYRHESFITLYNSECDSLYPKSYHDIVSEIIEKERIVKSLHESTTTRNTKTCLERLKDNRTKMGDMIDNDNNNIDNKKKNGYKQHDNDNNGQIRAMSSHVSISSGNQSFDKIMNQNFRNLIQNVHQRNNKQKQEKDADQEEQLLNEEMVEEEKPLHDPIKNNVGRNNNNDVKCDDRNNSRSTINSTTNTKKPNGVRKTSPRSVNADTSATKSPSNSVPSDDDDDDDNDDEDDNYTGKPPRRFWKSRIPGRSINITNHNNNHGTTTPSSLKRAANDVVCIDRNNNDTNVNASNNKRQCHSISSLTKSNNKVAVYSIDDENDGSKKLFTKNDNNHHTQYQHHSNDRIKSHTVTKNPSSSVWNCPTCTFRNEKHTLRNAVCEICANPRPLFKTPRGSSSGSNTVVSSSIHLR